MDQLHANSSVFVLFYCPHALQNERFLANLKQLESFYSRTVLVCKMTLTLLLHQIEEGLYPCTLMCLRERERAFERAFVFSFYFRSELFHKCIYRQEINFEHITSFYIIQIKTYRALLLFFKVQLKFNSYCQLQITQHLFLKCIITSIGTYQSSRPHGQKCSLYLT